MKNLLKGVLFVGVIIACSAVASAQQVEWSFPREGMETKTIAGKTAYKIGKNIYGVHDEYNGNPIVIIFLPENLDALIDNVNATEKNGIPDKEKFMTALAVDAAIVTSEGKLSEYLGSGKFEGDNAYVYKTRNGVKVVAIVSKDHKYVVIAIPPQ